VVNKSLVLSATMKAKTVFCNMLLCKCFCFAQVNVHLFLQIYAVLAFTLSIDKKNTPFLRQLASYLILKDVSKNDLYATQTLHAKYICH